MRQAIITAALLVAACGDSTGTPEISANNAASTETAQQQNVDNQLIETNNGGSVLRLEGNDSATFVDGELVEVNRAQ